MPMPARTASEREAFMAQLKSEIPAFVHHLLNTHVISEDLADNEEERMGVRGYHNSHAMSFVDSYSNDGERLLTIIDCLRQYIDPQEDAWRGNSSTLLKFLRSHDIERMATATSLGRFLNQRISNGSRSIKRIAHREYEIDLSVNNFPQIHEVKSVDKVQGYLDEAPRPIVELSQADLNFDDDTPYGHHIA